MAEVFHARPGEVEEMIRRRLEERSWAEEEEGRVAAGVQGGGVAYGQEL